MHRHHRGIGPGSLHRWIITVAVATAAVGSPMIASASADPTDDELFGMVGEHVPTFGGAYLASDGTLRIWLTEPSDQAARQAQQALVELVGPEFAVERYEVLRARYSFLELKGWYDAARDVHLAVPDLVTSAIDEQQNRIAFGVVHADRNREAMQDELARLGIPLDAVIIEDSSPISTRGSSVGLLLGLLLLSLGSIALLVTWRYVKRARNQAATSSPPS